MDVINGAGSRGIRGLVGMNGLLYVTSFSSDEVEVYKSTSPFTMQYIITVNGLDLPCWVSAYPERNEIKLSEYSGKCWVIDTSQNLVTCEDTAYQNPEESDSAPTSSFISSTNQYICDINGKRKLAQIPQTVKANCVVELKSDRLLVADRNSRVVLMNSSFELVSVLLDFKSLNLSQVRTPAEPWRLYYSMSNHLLYVGLREGGIHILKWKPCTIEPLDSKLANSYTDMN